MTDFNSKTDLIDLNVGVPRHVVFRDFVSETVLLNIETGQYHGLDPVGGRMLQVLDQLGNVRGAAIALAEEFAQPLERIEQDLDEFCEALLTRGLLEVRSPSGG